MLRRIRLLQYNQHLLCPCFSVCVISQCLIFLLNIIVEVKQCHKPVFAYQFGESSEKVIEHYEKADYCSRDIYENDKRIKECVDFIVSEKMLALGHKENLERLHHELVSKDWFMTLLDFNDYVEKNPAFAI